MANRVVVTGIGMVSPLGLDLHSTWEALLAGKSGVADTTLFDPKDFDTKFSAEVKGFDPAKYVDRKEARRMDRFVQFAVVAALEAVEHAGLVINSDNRDDIGVIIGSGIGGITTLSEQFKVLLERGPGRVSPFLIPMMIVDMAAGQVSITLGARGPNFCTTSACASGADAIGVASEFIRRGDAKVVVAGGSEAPLTPIGMAAFNSLRALSTRNDAPQKASRPFDIGRDGFVMAEGAAVLILESLEYARGRGAPILAEILGYGATGDGFHITQPAEGGEGGARAMRMAMIKAGIDRTKVGYINAHGTSTLLNDKLETMAIKSVFGEHAYKLAISSTKSMTGHMLGAAGAVEAAVSIMAFQSGWLPPTINLDDPDPECDLDYIPHQAREARVDVVLSNSLGFGGHNSTLLFGRFDGND
ncbi:MAG: beta-ketoacyl-ACP synthase II [Dehalococcoidia bacterium]|nr:beta-ketoacyl-ACP synthase II [Dehalococcoidia bacterium]